MCIGARALLINQDCIKKCGIELIVKLQVSTEHKHLNKLAAYKYSMLLKESVNREI